MGLINWLRGYIPGLAALTAPLAELTGKTDRFKWTEECEASWTKTHEALEQPHKLERPNPAWKFILQVDASDAGMGAVLMQLDGEEKKHIIHYSSAKYHQNEKNYHVNEKECLAMVWAIKRYRPYLEDKVFILKTNNRALVWLSNHRDDRAKLTRWSLLLQEFTFKVERVPGRTNELPDFLSRNPTKDPQPNRNYMEE
ncbi:unnamed protein product, partial [Brassicogethes aeneus]